MAADFQGYVHFLDKATGALAARLRQQVRVSTTPLVVGNLVLVVNDRGQISVYRVSPLSTRGKKQASVPPPAAPSAPAAPAAAGNAGA